MMKKFSAIALTATMILSLVGCSKKNYDGDYTAEIDLSKVFIEDKIKGLRLTVSLFVSMKFYLQPSSSKSFPTLLPILFFNPIVSSQ